MGSDNGRSEGLGNEEIRGALERLPCWKDAVMMSVLMPYYTLGEFNELDKYGEGRKISGVLQLLGLIEKTEQRRYQISPRGKAFVKWAIGTRIITPYDGADFVVKFGQKFGRRIMYDLVFVPDAAKPPALELVKPKERKVEAEAGV